MSQDEKTKREDEDPAAPTTEEAESTYDTYTDRSPHSCPPSVTQEEATGEPAAPPDPGRRGVIITEPE